MSHRESSVQTPNPESPETGSDDSPPEAKKFVPDGAPPPASQGRRKARSFGSGGEAKQSDPVSGTRQPVQGPPVQGPARNPVTEDPLEPAVAATTGADTAEASRSLQEGPGPGYGAEGRSGEGPGDAYGDALGDTHTTKYLREHPEEDLSQEPDETLEGGGLSGFNRILLICLAAVILISGFFGARMILGRDDSTGASANGAGEGAPDGPPSGGDKLLTRSPGGALLTPGALGVEDTGIVFESLPQSDNGQVTLRARDTRAGEDYAWEGTIEKVKADKDASSDASGGAESSASDSAEDSAVSSAGGGNFDSLLLEGRTYADFRGNFGLPKGDLRGGTFAWAVPGGLVVKAEYDQANEPSGGSDAPNQEADGSFKVLKEKTGQILLSGTYSDVRDPGSAEVVRTYIEREPGAENWEVYRRKFEAPRETLIPMLVGFEEPKIEEGGE